MLFVGLLAFLGTACKTKSGCPTSQYRAKVNKKGMLSTKKGSSNLFSKSMRKKMR